MLFAHFGGFKVLWLIKQRKHESEKRIRKAKRERDSREVLQLLTGNRRAREIHLFFLINS